jgi:acyl-CoA dehydrogenase
VASLLLKPGAARDRLTAGIYHSDDPDDITGCLEDALHKVIKAEPIERRLRHEQITRHGLEDYPQWVDNLLGSGQVSAEEADILLQARSATARVIRVDDFTPEQMTNKSGVAKPAESSKKAVKKKAVNKKSVANKKRVRGAA